MFSSSQLEQYAEIMLWALDASRPAPIESGDAVLVRFDIPALELAEALHRRLVKRHVNTVIRMNRTAAMEKDFYMNASPGQLSFVSHGTSDLFEQVAGSIHLLAPQALTHLADADPADIAAAARARKPFRDILDRRELKGDFSWTLCLYPTAGLAEKAGLSLEEYARQVAKACYLDRPDPLGEWKQTMKRVKELRSWLDGLDARRFRVESEHMDIEIDPGEARSWEGLTGHNIPSFELYLSPDWRGTRGVYYADQPSYRGGNYVEGVRLEFVDGRVVDATADRGEHFLQEQLRMDEGASKLGEFSLTDKRFSGISKFMAMTLFDENFGGDFGNCHVALGASYPSTYAGNPAELSDERRRDLGFNSSALHWDLVNTEPKIVTATLADGKTKVVYENGLFAC
ncbi:aminopeptidase [Desulfovibrio ferrophilus]|uniref:Leucyl aminopeptidase n=1 Tax=Desulfovibrio ferrophilus TaxID=241368 RepID=A0A2Z6AWC8_9BACT|nr:aminopeptidase [Desulfovibrio ferrophilus]BBD07493.1 leucyl aminopeptidase [Desulfovibrio ferrophilus]